MVNNYTNINKVNNHLSPKSIGHKKKKGPRNMKLEIQVLVRVVFAVVFIDIV